MAIVKVYPNGLTFGRPGVGGAREKTRGTIQGWTPAVARRQRTWLYSVITAELSGVGYAITLTMRECPETSEDWHAMRSALFKRFRRVPGFLRLHWVTEWQRRGVPHLHLAVYFSETLPALGWELIKHWQEVAEARGVSARASAQDVKPIDGALGWLRYLAKHAGRTASHYQRSGMPKGWTKTGRLWGSGGDWPRVEAAEARLTHEQTLQLRRLLRGYVLAEARRVGDWRRVAFLRRYPAREQDPWLSSVRGGSEWISDEVTLRLLEHVSKES